MEILFLRNRDSDMLGIKWVGKHVAKHLESGNLEMAG
jgi:hypothetical protein